LPIHIKRLISQDVGYIWLKTMSKQEEICGSFTWPKEQLKEFFTSY